MKVRLEEAVQEEMIQWSLRAPGSTCKLSKPVMGLWVLLNTAS
jgi:hypothetical protein